MNDYSEIIGRHEKIALQLSGGRDSIACLYLMRPYLDRITVYWTNAGDPYPETVSMIQKLKELAPNFVEIEGRQPEVIAQFGIPTDILPASSTPMGVSATNEGVLMQDRYTCCLRSMMMPMHERMHADGVTLIIRGQKNADRLKSSVRSGDIADGIEFLFPIEDWSTSDVMTYLRKEKAPIPRFYEMLNSAPDCMTCTAYWEEGALSYQKRYHHAQFLENQERLNIIREAIDPHIFAFNKEFGL